MKRLFYLVVLCLAGIVLVGCERGETSQRPFPTKAAYRLTIEPQIATRDKHLRDGTGNFSGLGPLRSSSGSSVRLYCPECQEAGMKINIWETPSRAGLKTTGSLPHGTQVTVIDKAYHDGMSQYKITHQGITGWVSELMIR